MGQPSKTDPIDARLLSQFAAVIKSANSRSTSVEQDDLRALVQQRENFVQQRDDDKRRLKTASSEAVKPALQSHIDYLCEAVKSIEQLIRQSAESLDREKEIGRASCRERVCQYVKISVGAVSLKKKYKIQTRDSCEEI